MATSSSNPSGAKARHHSRKTPTAARTRKPAADGVHHHFDPAEDPGRAGPGDRRARRPGTRRREPARPRRTSSRPFANWRPSTAPARASSASSSASSAAAHRPQPLRAPGSPHAHEVRARAAPAPHPRRAHGQAEPPPPRARGPRGAQGPGEAVQDVELERREARHRRAGRLLGAYQRLPPPAPRRATRAGQVRRPHILAGECSTLSSLNRRGVTQVAPRRSLRRRHCAAAARARGAPSARMDPMPIKEQVIESLRAVIDPELRRDIVELEMVRSIDDPRERRRRRDGLADDARLPDPQPLPDRRRAGRARARRRRRRSTSASTSSPTTRRPRSAASSAAARCPRARWPRSAT